MKIWFCENCGKRVTETDLNQNLGRDKQAKGVYCVACEASVQTQSFDALQLQLSPSVAKDYEKIRSDAMLKSVRVRTGRAGLRTPPRGTLATLAKEKKSVSGLNRIPTVSPFVTKRMSIAALIVGALLLLSAILYCLSPAREPSQDKVEAEKPVSVSQPGSAHAPVAPKHAVFKTEPALAAAKNVPLAPPITKGDEERVKPAAAHAEIPEGYTALWKFQENEGWDVWWPGPEAKPFSATTTSSGYAVKIDAGAAELSLPVFSPLYKTRKPVAEMPEALAVDVDLQEGAASIELYLVDSQQEVLQYSRRKLDSGVNRVTWKMRSDLVASGGARANKLIDAPAFLWEMRLIRPASGAAIKAVFQSASVRETKTRADADATTTPLWNFDGTEKWAPWWPDERGKQPFRIERTSDGLTVTVDPQEKELKFTILESRYRSELTLGSPQFIALDVDVKQGKKVMLGLNVMDTKKEGFELEVKELKSGTNRVLWNLNRDCIRTWGEKQNGQIDYPINLWDLQIVCPASKEPLQFTLKRAMKS